MEKTLARVFVYTLMLVATTFVVMGCGNTPAIDAGACVAGSENSGLISWVADSYPANETAVLVVIDPASNTSPDLVNNFTVLVWSDTDINGISLTVRETGNDTAIFEGTVVLTTSAPSAGHLLMISASDAMTAEHRRTRATSCIE